MPHLCRINIAGALFILMVLAFSPLANAETSKDTVFPQTPSPGSASAGPETVEDVTGKDETAEKDNGEVPRKASMSSARGIITDQLQAIRKRDAHLLWQYVSKEYREDYRSPNEALKDIRRSKKPLFEHLSFNFLDSAVQNGKVVEKVELVTRSGGKVLAFFKLVKDEKDQWKIDHITLLQSDSQAI